MKMADAANVWYAVEDQAGELESISSRKRTCEEVWAEINRLQQDQKNNLERRMSGQPSNLGEMMTLEDFLIKAGVVREYRCRDELGMSGDRQSPASWSAASPNKGNGLTMEGEAVVERRQRRMIKNRESAARSRARKQAYTVELEAELNKLKEENAKLIEQERRLLQKRKQALLEAILNKSNRSLRRCSSSLS